MGNLAEHSDCIPPMVTFPRRLGFTCQQMIARRTSYCTLVSGNDLAGNSSFQPHWEVHEGENRSEGLQCP